MTPYKLVMQGDRNAFLFSGKMPTEIAVEFHAVLV